MQGDGRKARKRVISSAFARLAQRYPLGGWSAEEDAAALTQDIQDFHTSGDGDGVSFNTDLKCRGSRFMTEEIANQTATFLRRHKIRVRVYKCHRGHAHVQTWSALHP